MPGNTWVAPFVCLIFSDGIIDVAKEALDRCMECDEEKARAMIYDRYIIKDTYVSIHLKYMQYFFKVIL